MSKRSGVFPPVLALGLLAGLSLSLACEEVKEQSTNSLSGLSASSAGAGPAALLPMLNAFPQCQRTLDVGFSEEAVQFATAFNNFKGDFACFPTNNPVQIDVMEGAVRVVVEAAAVALPAPNPQTSVARFAIEGRSSITGGTASATPSWDIQVGYLFPHTGSPTGVEPIVFGATLLDANDTGGLSFPAVGSVSIDCGVGAPTILLLNQGPVDVAVEATSICGAECSCTASARLSGGAAATAGEVVQRLTVFAFNTNGLCGSNEICRQTDQNSPFCVDDFGCSNGSVGMPCDHDSQCDRASGVICAASTLCVDGAAGASCSQAGDCAVGLACRGNVCSGL